MAYISFHPLDNFKTHLYTGTGASNAQTFPATTAMQPDFTWIKNRDAEDFHVLTDSVRGATKYLKSNVDEVEVTNAESLKSFDSDGFTVGTMNEVNTNTEDFVSWNWKMGTTTGIAGSPSITPTAYSFNATAGQSIIQWTGTGANATLPHGLGVAPEFMIVKNYSEAARYWNVYHEQGIGNTKRMYLNTDAAAATAATAWNSTSPTSTLFSVGSNTDTNESGKTFVAYCFAPIKGYSKFAYYTGNGQADGPFIYTGFQPSFVMIKRIEGSFGWNIWDDKRKGYNGDQPTLFADAISANDAQCCRINLLSNGFKPTINNGQLNSAGGIYTYAAFAQSPIVSSNDVPGVAR